MSIALHNVTKTFGDFAAIRDISLAAETGEFLALLGPSGSGKTTLLRIMAGLEFPDSGSVSFEDQDVTGASVADRHIGFVFQHYALFQHMTVADNVAFGLTVRKRRDRPRRAEIRVRAQELLDLVQLGALGKRYPAQLSGGQRQRVALARALAVDPKLLLLDEPFGALDAKVRKELRRWLRDLHERVGLTSIFVTHDQEEALELADRVVVMNQGRIEQIATPDDIYRRPANAFVFDFVGESSAVPVIATDGVIRFGDAALDLPVTTDRDGAHLLCFRPHDVDRVGEGDGGLPVSATMVRPRAGGVRVEAEAPGVDKPVEADLEPGAAPTTGDRLWLKPRHACLYPVSEARS